MILAILLLAAVTLTAQVTPDQLRAPATVGLKLMAFRDGKPVLITLGPGLAITTAPDGSITISAAAANAISCGPLARASDGTYPASPGLVTRNGLVQRPGKDYSVNGGRMTPALPWGVDDEVMACSPG